MFAVGGCTGTVATDTKMSQGLDERNEMLQLQRFHTPAKPSRKAL